MPKSTSNTNLNNHRPQPSQKNREYAIQHGHRADKKTSADYRKLCPSDFPFNPLCFYYVQGDCTNKRCKKYHDESLRIRYRQANNNLRSLFDTAAMSPHPNFSVNCLICNRIVVSGETVHKIKHNCVWAYALKEENIWISSEKTQHPVKVDFTQQSIFCVCSRWLGDYLEGYQCSESQVRVEYKIVVYQQNGKISSNWSGSQESHTKLEPLPHPIAWNSEKRDAENLLVKASNLLNMNVPSLNEAHELVRKAHPETLGT